MPDSSNVGLYVHVPFCARKCDYCAFYSETSDGELKDRYVQALLLEMGRRMVHHKPDTLFFGGGTPSLLSLRHWDRIIQAVHDLRLQPTAEWTVECNPATVSFEKAKMLRDGGVNRISMGVQSLDPDLLTQLGRVHSREMVFKSWDILRSAGFENINLDLMFAIPGQTLKTWDATLGEVISLGSEHLACYEVIYEEDTPLFHQMQAGAFQVDEDLACTMYDRLIEKAHEAGFYQYEVANFSKDTHPTPDGETNIASTPSKACRHNIRYWRGGDYIGLGPSAVGREKNTYHWNVSHTRAYCDRVLSGLDACDRQETLSPEKRAGEVAAFGLRMPRGWNFREFRQITGFDLPGDWSDEMSQLEGMGHAIRDAHSFRLTPLGLRFADAAAQLFLRS